MNAKHTPGPWRAEYESDDPSWRVYAQLGEGIGGSWLICRVSRYAAPDETGEANAKLIAAAPALADALELEVLACGDRCGDGCHQAARAALRQAGRLP